MIRKFEIVVSAIGMPPEARDQLKKCSRAMAFACSPGANDESYWLSQGVPDSMTDAEACHYLSWRASDLAKLKFSVFSRSLIWRSE